MKSLKTCLLAFSLAIFIVSALPGTAHAIFGFFEKKEEALPPPQFLIHDEESFAANTKLRHEIPFNNPKFEFEIALPADWQADTALQRITFTLSDQIMNDIARFKSPLIGVSRAVVTIQALQLTRELSAENWLKEYIFQNGYTLQDKISAPTSKKAAASFIYFYEGKNMQSYVTLLFNGNVAILVKFDIPLPLKNLLAFFQKRSVDSFKLVTITDDPIETQKTLSLANALKLNYPSSWKAQQPVFKNMDSMSVQILGDGMNKKVNGYIDLRAVRRTRETTLLKEMETLKKSISDTLGMEPRELLSSGKAETSGRFVFAQQESYRMGPKEGKNSLDHELRLAVLGDREWYIIVFLLSPQEINDSSSWANNVQTFDLIVKSLR